MKLPNYLYFFLSILICVSCKSKSLKSDPAEVVNVSEEPTDIETRFIPKLVLAQWTFNKDLFAGNMSTEDFVLKASDLGFEGVEFVSQFFQDKVEDEAYLYHLRGVSESVGIKNTMIAVDIPDARLGASDFKERNISIDEHKKWIVAASKLDCPTIRVNAYGDGSSEMVMSAVFESVKELANYGKRYGVRIAIENHGQYSSDGKWLSTLVGKLFPYGVGSVADFDNWCIERENGKLWGATCIKEYDRYLGIKELLPTATSISLKAFDFNQEGNAVKTDFKKMFNLIKESQYDEYLAVEFEGHDMDPVEGIRKTLQLVEKCM